MTKLIVQKGANKGASYELADEPVTLGRDLTCHIQVPDPRISRHHARIAREADRWVLTDLDSRNGTLVNATPIETHTLASLDEIAIGDTVLLFVADAEGHYELPPDNDAWIRPTIAETIVTDRIKLLSRGSVTPSREELERMNEGLITLFRYSNSASDAPSVPQLLELLTRAIDEAIQPDRVVPIVIDPTSGERRPWTRQASAFERKLAEVPVSRSIIDFAFDEGLSVLSHAPADDERFRHSPSVQLNRIATAMCVPLRSGDDLLGAIYVDRIGEAQPFDRTDLEFLTALAMPTVVALGSLRTAESLHRECQVLGREVRGRYQIIGESPPIQAVFDFIEKAAPLDSGVLLIGESGTGKELVARAIHYSGPLAKGPFEALNCAALTETLLESELFGHVKGAFTGAHDDRAGRFELARNGTLFLDEIAEMPLASQGKLLRVIESGEFRRIGDVADRTSNARVLAATNRNLDELVEADEFRRDLYYRLNILTCHLPPLRDRGDDVDLLVDHFLAEFARTCGRRGVGFTDSARAVLRKAHWPGNVRELRNVVERLVALSEKPVIDADDLPPELTTGPAARPAPLASLHDVEHQHIEHILRQTGGNKKEAARILGIDRSTLYAKIRTYKINV